MLPVAGEARKPHKDLLSRVHERTGLGVDIQTWTNGNVEIRWKRDYEGEWSDERFAIADSLDGALQAVLDYEKRADREEADGL